MWGEKLKGLRDWGLRKWMGTVSQVTKSRSSNSSTALRLLPPHTSGRCLAHHLLLG